MKRYDQIKRAAEKRHVSLHNLTKKLKLRNILTIKLDGTSECGCNNNAVMHKEVFSCFLPSTYAGHVGLAVTKHQ